jgi:outer membrane protein TolC
VLAIPLLLGCAAGRAAAEPLAATEGDAVGLPLGCEAAVQLVLAAHPLVEAAEAGLREAEANASFLRWIDSPELRLRTDAGSIDDDHRVGLRWPLPAPGAAGARARAGQAGADRRAAEIDRTRAVLAAEVRRDYAAVRHASADAAVLERLADHASRYADAVSGLMRAGSATVLEQETARLRATETEERAATARDRERLALEAAKRWTGRSPSRDNDECAGDADLGPDGDILETHPDIRIARARAAAAEQDAVATRREAWVWPSFVEVTWIRETDGKDRDGVLLQTGVELPVTGRRSEEAEAREQKLALRSRSIEQGIGAEVEAARLGYRNAREKVKRIEARGEDVKRARDLLARGAKAGADPGEVWRLAREIADWEIEANQARYEEELARIQLRLSAGLP